MTLGMLLCREHANGLISRHRITEVEAYDGPHDEACHAHKGLTTRTEVMFGPAGYWYVYLCYGVHWMLNIVTGPQNYPAAVLIRGVEGIKGPGRLTKLLQINKEFNAMAADRESRLWLEHNPIPYHLKIERRPRIGIDYAGPVWREILYNLSCD